MKHTIALAALLEQINEDLKTNEKQLTAARDKVAKLEGQAAGLRQQLARAQNEAALKEDNCPQCYAQHGNEQALHTGDSHDSGPRCPACNWTHVAIPQPPLAVSQ